MAPHAERAEVDVVFVVEALVEDGDLEVRRRPHRRR